MRATGKMWARRAHSLVEVFTRPVKNVGASICKGKRYIFKHVDKSVIVFFLVMFGVIGVMGYNLYFSDASIHYRLRTASPVKIEEAAKNQCVKGQLQIFINGNSSVITNGRIIDAQKRCSAVPVLEDQRRQLGLDEGMK